MAKVIIEKVPGWPGWSWIEKDEDGIIVRHGSGYVTEQEARDASPSVAQPDYLGHARDLSLSAHD